MQLTDHSVSATRLRCYQRCQLQYYSVTKMLLALGLPSFDTVIHNYSNSFPSVWSNHSNDMMKLLRCVCPSAFLWVLLCFIVHLVLLLSFFYLYCLSVCLYVPCLYLWALLPDLNKMMMMMINMVYIGCTDWWSGIGNTMPISSTPGNQSVAYVL